MEALIYHSIYNTDTFFSGDITAYGPHMTIFIPNYGTDPISGDELGTLYCCQQHPEGGGIVLTPTAQWQYESGNPDVGSGALTFSRSYFPGTGQQTRLGYDIFVCGFTGTATSGFIGADYYFATVEDFMTAYDNGEVTPILPKVYFDVYINGTDKPSISVNWTASEDLSVPLLAPRVWLLVNDLIPLDPVVVEYKGYMVPNAAGNWAIEYAGQQSYAGSYSTTYLSIMEVFEQALNPVSKVEHWGFDGVPSFVELMLRMDYDGGDTWGELHRAKILLDGTPSDQAVPDSGFGNYETIVRFHTGEPDYQIPDDDNTYASGSNIDGDGDGRYDPDALPDIPDFSETEGDGFDGNAVLTRTYAVSQQTLQNIGQKLWSQSYFNVLKIQSNPIENIISVKEFPFAFTGTSEEIKVGDIPFGVNGDKIRSVQKYPIGSYKYTGSGTNSSYLDLAPYTITKLYLPYIGLVQLDASDLFGSSLQVDYVIDLVTGQCMAMLTLDGTPYMNIYGNMGIDIPLTSTDRVQTELRAASAAISAVNGISSQAIAGHAGDAAVSGVAATLNLLGTDYNSQRTSNQSPACASYENHMVFLQIDTPLYKKDPSEGYQHLHGYPCHKFMTPANIYANANSEQQERGVFMAVDRRTDIKVAMTAEENAMLERLLMEGIYIGKEKP